MVDIYTCVCVFVSRPEGNNYVCICVYVAGKSGGWKEEFTVAMNERFDQYWSQAFKSQHVFPIPQM